MDRLRAENAGAVEDDRPAPTEDELPIEHAGEGESSDDPVEDASADSFPASDPPSFTGSTAVRDSAVRDAADQGEG